MQGAPARSALVSGIALQGNLAQARHLLEQAAQAGAELAVLPE